MTNKKRVTIYINDDVMSILDSIKERDGVSKSETINSALNEYMIKYIEQKQKIKKYADSIRS